MTSIFPVFSGQKKIGGGGRGADFEVVGTIFVANRIYYGSIPNYNFLNKYELSFTFKSSYPPHPLPKSQPRKAPPPVHSSQPKQTIGLFTWTTFFQAPRGFS